MGGDSAPLQQTTKNKKLATERLFMALAITEKAAEEVKRVIADRHEDEKDELVLRVGVTGGGWSGFS